MNLLSPQTPNAVLLRIHPSDRSASLPVPQGSSRSGQLKAKRPKYPQKGDPRRSKFNHHAIIKFTLTTELAIKKPEDRNTLVFIVDVKTNKNQIKEAVKKFYDVEMAKVNTVIRHKGDKKAYVLLALDFDTLDVANKIGVM
ncbi:60S ribosomal protein L23a-like [Felis catus]|uniref:60S ribosomal protein L23a-like n=1 Tax=Felis catus TaxID=9685 RepID=UPI001D1A0689|nr:60S ribosomal protein L23a-like [Felis catus]